MKCGVGTCDSECLVGFYCWVLNNVGAKAPLTTALLQARLMSTAP